MIDIKLVDSVFKTIMRTNLGETKDSIPNSVTFSRLMSSQYGIDDETFFEIISILNESHKIFIFEIQRSTTDSSIKIEGYIDADVVTIRKLITTYGKILIRSYKDKHGKEISAQSIIKELMANISSMVNSEMGMVANKFIMLNEYEKLIQKQYQEYTEEWKEKKLIEILAQRETSKKRSIADEIEITNNIEDVSKQTKNEEKRTVNTPEYEEYDHKKNNIPVEKLLNIYGIEFFLRVHFRKYDFVLVEKMVKTRVINRKNELMILKKMLETVKSHIHFDKNLPNHIMEVYCLERVVNQRLI